MRYTMRQLQFDLLFLAAEISACAAVMIFGVLR